METDKNDGLIKPAACAANFPVSYIVQQLIDLNIATTIGVSPFPSDTANQDLELVHGVVNGNGESAAGFVEDSKIQPNVSPNAPENKPEVAGGPGGGENGREAFNGNQAEPFGVRLDSNKTSLLLGSESVRFVGNNQGEIIDVRVLGGGPNLAARGGGT